MSQPLPTLLAGPVLRHATTRELVFWLATSEPCPISLALHQPELEPQRQSPQVQTIPVGRRCFIHLITLTLNTPLPTDTLIAYDLFLGDEPEGLCERLPYLAYDGETRPAFTLKHRVENLLHGSCRKPHHPGRDGLCDADDWLSDTRDSEQCPAFLLLTGDQIYADDVAGPTLSAIHQLIAKLELFDEHFEGATVSNTRELLSSAHNYYEREQLLPRDRANRDLIDLFFGGAEKPIFTASGAHNHLISLAEVFAMYLLSWSPIPWQLVDIKTLPAGLAQRHQSRYTQELSAIEPFVAGLPQVHRLLAHIPSYMIFDDHDITDDWNLTRGWEETAYGHPFSRRIIGNALIAYWLCQGWGNRPEYFEALNRDVTQHFSRDGFHRQDELIDRLLDWEHWHYELDTDPAVVVLDTRTHRWRSESSPGKPSGLMDWEALTEMQQKLIGRDTVILVSPSPIFGVKFIEMIQRVFTFFGKALLVDAENWMAHPGAANVMLNIFRHSKTPPHFIILSGDVHYSFVYDVSLRQRKRSPEITQITASGLKNTFPESLLTWFDRLNRWLYASRSPLNWFTKRRRMKIRQRRIEHGGHRTLLNRCGIGVVQVKNNGDDVDARVFSEGHTIGFINKRDTQGHTHDG